jgi:hypothetical protein
MLRNTMKGILPDAVLTDPFYTKRPEELSVQEWAAMARIDGMTSN